MKNDYWKKEYFKLANLVWFMNYSTVTTPEEKLKEVMSKVNEGVGLYSEAIFKENKND